ncbi:MAG TPA: hemerythrin domain-containing protein [Myxococcota bacterium]|nr:hemerythrin domain-containing protein [Myxococcota bacterium]
MPDDPRSQLLADHALLRARLVAIAELARAVRMGESDDLGALRAAAGDLLAELRRHLAREERLLDDALATGAGDEDRAVRERLAREHAEQELLLDHIVADVADARRPPRLLGEKLQDFVGCLLEDMALEERTLLARLGPPSARRSDSATSA